MHGTHTSSGEAPAESSSSPEVRKLVHAASRMVLLLKLCPAARAQLGSAAGHACAACGH